MHRLTRDLCIVTRAACTHASTPREYSTVLFSVRVNIYTFMLQCCTARTRRERARGVCVIVMICLPFVCVCVRLRACAKVNRFIMHIKAAAVNQKERARSGGVRVFINKHILYLLYTFKLHTHLFVCVCVCAPRRLYNVGGEVSKFPHHNLYAPHLCTLRAHESGI